MHFCSDFVLPLFDYYITAHTKGNPKVRGLYGKMTSQAKKFVVMIMLIIIIVNTKNLMFNSVLVSSLEFFKDGYPTQNMETGNSE